MVLLHRFNYKLQLFSAAELKMCCILEGVLKRCFNEGFLQILCSCGSFKSTATFRSTFLVASVMQEIREDQRSFMFNRTVGSALHF